VKHVSLEELYEKTVGQLERVSPAPWNGAGCWKFQRQKIPFSYIEKWFPKQQMFACRITIETCFYLYRDWHICPGKIDKASSLPITRQGGDVASGDWTTSFSVCSGASQCLSSKGVNLKPCRVTQPCLSGLPSLRLPSLATDQTPFKQSKRLRYKHER
jgi:hypothetical protein